MQDAKTADAELLDGGLADYDHSRGVNSGDGISVQEKIDEMVGVKPSEDLNINITDHKTLNNISV